jgi:hypothetical protein
MQPSASGSFLLEGFFEFQLEREEGMDIEAARLSKRVLKSPKIRYTRPGSIT